MGEQPTETTPTTETGVKKIQKGVKKSVEKNTPVKKQGYSTDDFYFESGQEGIILKHKVKTDFSQRLSDQPIESAEITGGILVFQEKNGLQAQQIFNLEEIISSWK
ncbi:hypothetical protein CSB37_03210 [bacterium DOLZORAL124_38_8]|nr:MAG: hypothetical protein CSB37_03210 [bacterium DOLZORAL124_38_8]